MFQVFHLDVAKYIWMLHNMHVSSACFKCFRCFIRMLRVFHLDVIKVDLDVAYVVMAIYACLKYFFSRMCGKCFN
jgi:hypothetical protein